MKPLDRSSAHPTQAAPSGVPDNHRQAVLFVLGAVMVLPVINACAKYLVDYSVFQVTWARYAGHFAFMLVVFVPRSGLALRSEQSYLLSVLPRAFSKDLALLLRGDRWAGQRLLMRLTGLSGALLGYTLDTLETSHRQRRPDKPLPQS